MATIGDEMNTTRMMGSKIEASRARGSAIRARMEHNGQKPIVRDRMDLSKPFWPDFKPGKHKGKTLEEMLK